MAFVLGGGPSLLSVNLDLIKDRRVIGVNNSYGTPVIDKDGMAKVKPDGRVCYTPRNWIDACWFHDRRWFDWHRDSLVDFPGIIAHCCPQLQVAGLHYFERGKPAGIDEKIGRVASNGNSGMSAINFAYHLGVRRVVLLGFDMKMVDGNPNWHKDHKTRPYTLKHQPYFRFLRRAEYVRKDAIKLNLEIINCTPGSAMTQWPIMSLEEYLEEEVKEGTRHAA